MFNGYREVYKLLGSSWNRLNTSRKRRTDSARTLAFGIRPIEHHGTTTTDLLGVSKVSALPGELIAVHTRPYIFRYARVCATDTLDSTVEGLSMVLSLGFDSTVLMQPFYHIRFRFLPSNVCHGLFVLNASPSRCYCPPPNIHKTLLVRMCSPENRNLKRLVCRKREKKSFQARFEAVIHLESLEVVVAISILTVLEWSRPCGLPECRAELHFPATSPRRISSGGFAVSLLAECQGLMNTRRRIIVALWVLLNGGVNLWLACPSSHRKSAPITSNETEFEATRCQFASAEGLLGQVLGVLFVERLLCSHAAVTDLIFTLEMKEGMPFVLALQRMLRGTGGGIHLKKHTVEKNSFSTKNTLRYDDGATRWVRYYPYQWPYFYPIGWHPHSTDRVHPTRNGSPNHPSKTNCTPKALGSPEKLNVHKNDSESWDYTVSMRIRIKRSSSGDTVPVDFRLIDSDDAHVYLLRAAACMVENRKIEPPPRKLFRLMEVVLCARKKRIHLSFPAEGRRAAKAFQSLFSHIDGKIRDEYGVDGCGMKVWKIGLIKPIHCSRCVLDDVVDDGLSTESFGQDVECGGCGCPQTFASRYLSPVSAISVDRTTKPVLVECGLPRRRHYSRFSDRSRNRPPPLDTKGAANWDIEQCLYRGARYLISWRGSVSCPLRKDVVALVVFGMVASVASRRGGAWGKFPSNFAHPSSLGVLTRGIKEVAFLAETKLLGKQGGSGGGCVRGTPRRNAGVERANSAIVEIISAFSWITPFDITIRWGRCLDDDAQMKSGSCGPGAVHLVSQLTLSRGRDVQDFRFSLGPIPASGIPAIDAFLTANWESGGGGVDGGPPPFDPSPGPSSFPPFISLQIDVFPDSRCLPVTATEFLENVQIGAAADGDGNLVAVSFSHLPEVPQDLAAFEATNGALDENGNFTYSKADENSCGRLKNFMCTSAKKCFLSSPVFKPRLRLGQKTQPRTKKMHFLASIRK
ncbi:hypothetical protein GEV33_009422 [Tenebrio molitor]|uniref:Uncharacterized protein n=1 Tax=Tenebrio molitor TaxID=7067 RepID=A0A8J6L8A1_TENMO|nr:hypothetical protein GEV33_009422 [Tenebrio molitor]